MGPHIQLARSFGVGYQGFQLKDLLAQSFDLFGHILKAINHAVLGALSVDVIKTLMTVIKLAAAPKGSILVENVGLSDVGFCGPIGIPAFSRISE